MERNELLAEQLACSRAEGKLNIQGKKVALVAQVSQLLRKERQALRDFKGQVNYDSDDSECLEIKANIVYYKKKTQEAKSDLEDPTNRAGHSPERFSTPTVSRLSTPTGSTGLPSSVTFTVTSATGNRSRKEKTIAPALTADSLDTIENIDGN
jgi:hypothetical protein